MKIKLKDPNHWSSVEAGKAWASEVRMLCRKIGLTVKDNNNAESFFYVNGNELRGCSHHRFESSECEEVTIEQLRQAIYWSENAAMRII